MSTYTYLQLQAPSHRKQNCSVSVAYRKKIENMDLPHYEKFWQNGPKPSTVAMIEIIAFLTKRNCFKIDLWMFSLTELLYYLMFTRVDCFSIFNYLSHLFSKISTYYVICVLYNIGRSAV